MSSWKKKKQHKEFGFRRILVQTLLLIGFVIGSFKFLELRLITFNEQSSYPPHLNVEKINRNLLWGRI